MREDRGLPTEWTPSTAVVPPIGLEYPSIDALSKMAAAPQFSFGSKPKRTDEKDPSIPGPGSYFESYTDHSARGRRTAPKFSFGAATRKELEKTRAPGPGAYGVRSFLESSKGFSCTPRRGKTVGGQPLERTPGPGSHDVRSQFGVSGPSPSITPRRKVDAAPEEKRRSVPGPGHYQPTDENPKQAKPPQFGFGSAPARPRIPSSWNADGLTPGPGAYRHEVNLNGRGPKWSMRARTANAKVGVLPDQEL